MHFRILKMIATSWLSDSSRVHQIRFRPGFRPGPCWGSLQRSPRPRNWFQGVGGRICTPLPPRRTPWIRHWRSRGCPKIAILHLYCTWPLQQCTH